MGSGQKPAGADQRLAVEGGGFIEVNWTPPLRVHGVGNGQDRYRICQRAVRVALPALGSLGSARRGR